MINESAQVAEVLQYYNKSSASASRQIKTNIFTTHDVIILWPLPRVRWLVSGTEHGTLGSVIMFCFDLLVSNDWSHLLGIIKLSQVSATQTPATLASHLACLLNTPDLDLPDTT